MKVGPGQKYGHQLPKVSGRSVRAPLGSTRRSGGVRAAVALAALSTLLMISPAAAQAISAMTDECERVGKGFFGEPRARTEMTYSGKRSDGTHAINGLIYLEARLADFACSYRPDGRQMVSFSADGRKQNAYLPGGNTSASGGETARVTGIAANDVLNVRSGPGTNFRKVGALANRDRVKILQCQTQGSTRWCEIEMMTDMRERGWVNGRYLTGGTATQLPSPPSVEPDATRTVRVRFPAGTTGTELTDRVPPGGTIRFVVGARVGQMLYTRVAGNGLEYRILLPSGRSLQSRVSADQEYRGQLFVSGDHVIEVINRTNRSRSFNIIISAD